MADRLDYELRAMEADSRAESAPRISLARNWHDIAYGYRLLADFTADAKATRSCATSHRNTADSGVVRLPINRACDTPATPMPIMPRTEQ
jgi:hypothetical protein